jgi:MFS family permease
MPDADSTLRPRPSYRALFAVPGLPQVVLSMQLARLAQSMVGVAIVLFVLAEYESPSLAGIVTFASVAPGLLVAPIMGALLDRHGRVRLMSLDYVIAAASLILISALSTAGVLTPALLTAIVVVTSITGVLGIIGLRTILPIMAPAHLWERVNALDSSGYVLSTILGPPIAAGLVALTTPQVALTAIAVPFVLAVVSLVGVTEPRSESTASGRIVADAWDGMRYTWRNRTLRGLGFSVSTLGIASGALTIVVPLVVLRSLGLDEAFVGLAWAASGVTGMVAAILFGRIDTRGRERRLITMAMALMAPAFALLLPAVGVFGSVDPSVGFALVVVAMGLYGIFDGLFGIAMFTLRQRATDPAWIGRAFAVSMAFNFAGFPIGAAIAGVLATRSLEVAVWLAVGAAVLAALLTQALVPVRSREETG